jgi:serine 3-dehydrogenase (NADP+)
VGKLNEKTALIIGATSGMGRETALCFAREGASLAIAGRRAGLLQNLGEQIAAETQCSALGIPCDATDREQVDSMVRAANAHLGRIDIVVFATGTNLPERAASVLTTEDWDMMIATNLNGAFYATRAALPVMRSQGGGLILYISSIAARKSDTVSGISYQAAKRGIDGLAFGVAEEERANGIRTSVIYPGLCETPLVY